MASYMCAHIAYASVWFHRLLSPHQGTQTRLKKRQWSFRGSDPSRKDGELHLITFLQRVRRPVQLHVCMLYIRGAPIDR